MSKKKTFNLHKIIFDELPANEYELAEQVGLINNEAFLALIDGGLFEMNMCLCCYSLNNPNDKKHKSEHMAKKSIAKILSFYDKRSYIKSISFERNNVILKSYMPKDDTIKQYQNSLDSTENVLRKLNAKTDDICAILPTCEPDNIWIYDNPKLRILLKKLKIPFYDAPLITIKKIKFKYRLLVIDSTNEDRSNLLETIIFHL